MLDFETYLKSSCNVPDAAACGIEYKYNNTTSIDRKTGGSRIGHVVTVKTTWTDKDARALRVNKIVFQNDEVSKASMKNLGTMSSVELNYKFRSAKGQIMRELIREKQEKINQMQMDVMMMSSYININNHHVQQMQEQVSLPGVVQSGVSGSAAKTSFDM